MRVLTEPQATPLPNTDTLEQMRQDIAAIRAAFSLPTASEPTQTKAPNPEPTHEPANKQSKNIMDFLSALLGGKEQPL